MTEEIQKQKYEKQERRTVKDYILHVRMLEEQSFEHQPDGRIYTVDRVEGWDDRRIVTTDGVRIPLEECLDDLEATQEQLVKLNENKK